MVKFIFFSSLLIGSLSLSAHQADLSTTMLVENDDGSWVLQVRSALTAYEYIIHNRYGKDSYKTAEEFQDLVLQLLEEHIVITFNEEEKSLLEHGLVRLGHETNVLFKLTKVPKDIQNISVANTSFKEIHRNQSALIIIKEGYEKKQFTLDNKNDHKVELKIYKNKFELVSPYNKSYNATSMSTTTIGILACIAFLLIILTVLFSRGRKTQLD